MAGCVIIGSREILESIPNKYLDFGFEQLSRMLGEENTVHRGIYMGNKPMLTVYTAIGGLGKPEERLADIVRYGRLQDWDEE